LRRGLDHVFLARERGQILTQHFHFTLAPPLERIGVAGVVPEHIVVAARGVDAFQSLVEVVLIHDRQTAGLFGENANAVLRLSQVLVPLMWIDWFGDVSTRNQTA